MNAIRIHDANDIANAVKHFSIFIDMRYVVVDIAAKNTNSLIQNELPKCKLKTFFAMKNWIMQVVNCTQRLVKAAPTA